VEALAISAWLRWIAAAGAPGHRPPATSAVLVTGLTAALSVAALRRVDAPVSWLRSLAAMGGLMAALVLVKVTVLPDQPWLPPGWIETSVRLLFRDPAGAFRVGLAAAVGAGIWWRGVSAGQVWAPTPRAQSTLGWGIGALATLALVSKLTGALALAPFISGIGVAGLGTLALARLDKSGSGRHRATRSMAPAWMAIVPATIALVMVAAAAGAAAVSIDAGDAVMRSLTPLPDVVQRLILLLLVAVLQLASALLRPLGERFAENFAEWAARLDRLSPVADQADPPPPPFATEIPQALFWAFRAGLLLAVTLAVALWLARAVRRYTTDATDGLDVERQLDWEPRRAMGDLKAAVRHALGRMVTGIAGDGRPGWVRERYAAYLSQMARIGRPRAATQTAREFLAIGQAAVAPAADDIAALTTAYERVRYAGAQLAPDELARLRGQSDRIRAHIAHIRESS
jgi:hypothetical protein